MDLWIYVVCQHFRKMKIRKKKQEPSKGYKIGKIKLICFFFQLPAVRTRATNKTLKNKR